MAKKLATKQAWEVLICCRRGELAWKARHLAADRETADFLVSENVKKYEAEYDDQVGAWISKDDETGDEMDIRLQETVIYSLIH